MVAHRQLDASGQDGRKSAVASVFGGKPGCGTLTVVFGVDLTKLFC